MFLDGQVVCISVLLKNLPFGKNILRNNPMNWSLAEKAITGISESILFNNLILIKEYAEILIFILDDLENG